MIIIAIHGFRTIIKPGVWILTEKVKELLIRSGKYPTVELIKLGYKNIIYDEYHKYGKFWNDNGYSSTLSRITEKINNDVDKKIVIIGHSLGGWSASLLANELISKGYTIEILIQIDAMPLFKESPVLTTSFIEEIMESDNETLILIHEKLHEDMRGPAIRISNKLLSLSQNLADPIIKDKIRPEIILSEKDHPHTHQRIYNSDKVTKHYYYYSSEGARSAVDQLVYIGTSFVSMPIKSDASNLYNVAIDKTHLLIDDDYQIYDKLLEDLGIDGRLTDLTLKKRFNDFMREQVELVEKKKSELSRKKEELSTILDEKKVVLRDKIREYRK